MKYSALIIDDESHARSFLSKLIEEYIPRIEVVGIASSALEGIKLMKNVDPDIIFLDIEMPNGNGFDFLDAVDRGRTKIIFTTAYQEFALNAIKYKADGYLLKPIDLDDLEELIESLQFQEKKTSDSLTRIVFKTLDSIEYVLPAEIIRVESDGNYSTIYKVDGKKLVISKNMKQIEAELPSTLFIKTHKSHLINLTQIVRYVKTDGGYFELSDGSIVPLSRRKKEEILTLLDRGIG